MSNVRNIGQRGVARRGLAAIVGVAAACMIVAPAAAQSPGPSVPAAASTVPAGSVAPGAGALPPGSSLEAIRAAFAAQACDPLLSAAEITATTGVAITGARGGHVTPFTDRKGFVGLDCAWTVDGGMVELKVEERRFAGKGKPKTRDLADNLDRGYTPDQTKLAGPGDAAFSDEGSERGYYPGRANVTWSLWTRHGKTYTDRWIGLVSDLLDVAALEDLANVVRSDATPGALPSAAVPGDDAAALAGSWTLAAFEIDQRAEAPFTMRTETPFTMTVTFDDAGTVTRTFDCEREKGEKPAVVTDLYFVEGDQVMMLTDGIPTAATCRMGTGPRFASETQHFLDVAFYATTSIDDGAWVVDGDTLTMTGLSNGKPLTMTYERAAD